jgi:hypothetical protein
MVKTTLGQRAVVDSYEQDDERQNFTTGKMINRAFNQLQKTRCRPTAIIFGKILPHYL